MFVRRFVFLLVIALLAIAGDAGTVLEATHQDGERCLICETAARPATMISSTRNIRPLKELAAERHIVRDEFVEKSTFYYSISLNDPSPAAHFRILLI